MNATTQLVYLWDDVPHSITVWEQNHIYTSLRAAHLNPIDRLSFAERMNALQEMLRKLDTSVMLAPVRRRQAHFTGRTGVTPYCSNVRESDVVYGFRQFKSMMALHPDRLCQECVVQAGLQMARTSQSQVTLRMLARIRERLQLAEL